MHKNRGIADPMDETPVVNTPRRHEHDAVGRLRVIQNPITPTTTDSAARFFSFSFFSNSRSVRDQSICRMSSPWEYAPIEFIALLSRITQSGH